MFDNFRVYLRALEPDDYKSSINWRKDDEIWSMVVGPKYYVSKVYEKKWVEDKIFNSKDEIILSVCIKEIERHIGYVYLNNIDWRNKKASFAILIGEKDIWGRGLATEATMLMLYHSFEVLGLERIEAKQLLTNISSIKVHEKCGFKTEGILRNAIFKDGKYRDLNLMSVIREDFLKILEKHKSEG